jgi:hypothetical protein
MIRTRKGHIISGSFFRASCDDDCVMMMMMSRCVKCLNACAVEMSRCGIQEYGMKGSLASGRLWQVLSCVCVCACVCVCHLLRSQGGLPQPCAYTIFGHMLEESLTNIAHVLLLAHTHTH